MIDKKLISKYLKRISPIRTPLERSGKLDHKMECILFDIYGTLFISASDDTGFSKNDAHNMSLINNLILKYNIGTDSRTLFQMLHDAVQNKHKEQMEKGVDYPEVRIDSLWNELLSFDDLSRARAFAVEFEMIVNPVYPMPNLQKVLSELKKRDIHMGLISNAQFYTPFLFEWFLGASVEELSFNRNLVFYSYEEGVAKPSARMFQLAASRLSNMGIHFENVLYIGNDMRNDILPARETGFKTALFAGDERSLRLRNDISKCREISPDVIITDLIHLLDFI